jgi:hypothetical protein
MRRVSAIALLTLRQAVRSRVVVLLLLLLLLAMVAVPLTVEGDGTLRGEAQMIITYSLGLVWVVLSAATLWMGCGSVAGDIRDRQIQCVLSAPVRRSELWLGKWLGLMLLNVVHLGLAGLLAHQALRFRMNSPVWSDADRDELRREVLNSHRALSPAALDIGSEVRQRLTDEIARKAVPPGREEARMRELRLQELQARRSAAPGETVEWKVALPAQLSEGTVLRLQYRFITGTGLGEITGRWWIGRPGEPRLRQAVVQEAGGALRRIDLPSDALVGTREVVLSFVNEDQDGDSVFFDPADGIRVLLPEGRFGGNLCFALLSILGHLAFLAALGVSAGAIFSLPVASTVAVFVLLLQQLSRFISSVAAGAEPWRTQEVTPTGGLLLDVIEQLFRLLNFLLSPLRFPNPLEMVSLGQSVGLTQVAGVWLVHFALYGLPAALVGILVLQRREVALPQ